MHLKFIAPTLFLLLLTACSSLQMASNATSTATYYLLADMRPVPLGPKSFIANLKWFAEETDNRLSLTFRTMPKDQSEAEYVALTQIVGGGGSKVASFPSARRTLFRMRLPETDTISQITYRPDGLRAHTSVGVISITMPLHRFGAIIEATPLSPDQPAEILLDPATTLGSQLVSPAPLQISQQSNSLTWTQGRYTLVFRHNGIVKSSDMNGVLLQTNGTQPLHIAVAFNIDLNEATADAEDLFAHSDHACTQSQKDWSAYLDSCPITHFTNGGGGYHAHDPATNEDLNYTDEQLSLRELWHWQVLLANCYDIDFNNMPAQLCPDKTTWFGSWSNDTPEALRALAHTNQRDFVRRALIGYVRAAITAEGDLSWYVHGTGVPGLGNPRDVGRLSHGVPAILTAINEYIEVTGDASILSAPAGGGNENTTVWQKLRTYMMNVFHRRLTSPDGLVAWADLWEGGADDKVGPFFSKADIGTWCNAVENMNDADLKNFYRQNSRPVVNLYEQAFFLNALEAMQKLAARAHDPQATEFAQEKFTHITQVLHDKYWSEADGFYYDYDLTTGQLVHVKNQDAFYLLRFLPNDPDRTEKLLAHFHNPDEFALPFLPTLAKNEPGFKADGYWCGGYWPRESAAVAYSLAAVGHSDEAELLLIKALMSSTGKVVLENVNPETGQPSTPIKTMAYSAVLNLALKDIHGK